MNELDEFVQELADMRMKLQECQQIKGLLPTGEHPNNEGCFACAELLTCHIRIAYVKAVHRSMNHGKEGGFEF